MLSRSRSRSRSLGTFAVSKHRDFFSGLSRLRDCILTILAGYFCMHSQSFKFHTDRLMLKEATACGHACWSGLSRWLQACRWLSFIIPRAHAATTTAVRRSHLRKIYMSNRYTAHACGNLFDIFSAILSKVAVGDLGQWPLASSECSEAVEWMGTRKTVDVLCI